jgi:hypothetical protein
MGESCTGWLLDVSIDNDHAILSIKTEDGQILKLTDSYCPTFYILPRNECLFQVLLDESPASRSISLPFVVYRKKLFGSI